MFMAVTLTTLITSFAQKTTALETCVPNTQFELNDRNCLCNSSGVWNDTKCNIIGRRQFCMPGQFVRVGCRTCICQANQRYFCSDANCAAQVSPIGRTEIQNLGSIGPFCIKFRPYYLNCSICTCPASGLSAEAKCMNDVGCVIRTAPTFKNLNEKCIASVMYIFQCLHCICSEQGLFLREKCLETCQKPFKEPTRPCTPKTIYRDNCNICQCPENGIKDDYKCTHTICTQPDQLINLTSVENGECIPHTFTKPTCVYCSCFQNGTVNERACMKQTCLEHIDYSINNTCTPGGMVPICKTCLCLRNGTVDNRFCTKSCTDKARSDILDRVLCDERPTIHLINIYDIQINVTINKCEPDSIYFNHNGYCVCPNTGDMDSKLCIKNQPDDSKTYVLINFTAPCTPSTFIEFDCNTCFCSKNGSIDPKWCTYDDCDAKRDMQQQTRDVLNHLVSFDNSTCSPGSIYKKICNFCICPENGRSNDSTCTTNTCDQATGPPVDEISFCEPLSYYKVDCNICYCPFNGKKNVNQCTKNQCESKNDLRSNSVCEKTELFVDICNPCVCAQNALKEQSVCTKHPCNEASVSWMRINDISKHLLDDPTHPLPQYSLDMCCPGEEFLLGCNFCVCPEIGLKMYAECTNKSCENLDNYNKLKLGYDLDLSDEKDFIDRRAVDYNIFNLNTAAPSECKPGSRYVIGCQECICPYNNSGSAKEFCRPHPSGVDCENITKKSRKTLQNENVKLSNSTSLRRVHTKYRCTTAGTLMDKCFMCECDKDEFVMIEEHCFRNQEEDCRNVKPEFLMEDGLEHKV